MTYHHRCRNFAQYAKLNTIYSQRSVIDSVTIYNEPYVQTSTKGFIDSAYFCRFVSSSSPIIIRNTGYSLDVQRTRFEGLVCNDNRIIQFEYGYNCTLSRCCFVSTSAIIASTIGIDAHDHSVLYGSINVTFELSCGHGRSVHASFCGGRNGCTFFHNNITDSSVRSMRSGFSLETSPFKEGTNGFCQSTACKGGPLIAFYLSQNSIFDKMNLINSTVPNGRGILSLYFGYTATLKEFIFDLKEQRNWVDSSNSDGRTKVILRSSKIIGYAPPEVSEIDASDALLVETVVLSSIKKNSWILCRQQSNHFSASSPSNDWRILVILVHILMIPS